MDDFYLGSGGIRYFLTDLPEWANFSQTAGCKRDFSTRFMNLSLLMGSYGLQYQEAIQFQYLFNRMHQEKLIVHSREYLPFRDEETLFFNVADKIRAKFYPFRSPKFNRIHLVWIDPALNSEKMRKRLVTLMNSAKMQAGHPVFISLCLNFAGVQKFMQDSNLTNRNIRVIPFQMFSPFDPSGEQIHVFSLFLNDVLGKSKEVILFAPNQRKPLEFKGKFRSIHSY